MNRKLQIEAAADSLVKHHPNTMKHHCDLYFKLGAEWADQNPAVPTEALPENVVNFHGLMIDTYLKLEAKLAIAEKEGGKYAYLSGVLKGKLNIAIEALKKISKGNGRDINGTLYSLVEETLLKIKDMK